jgi:hypothetical protein
MHRTDDQNVEFNYQAQLENQVLSLIRAIEENHAEGYTPFLIR